VKLLTNWNLLGNLQGYYIKMTEDTQVLRNATDTPVLRNATIDLPVSQIGISKRHLVRPLDDRHIAELVETDANEWDPIEVRVWPDDLPKPTPDVAYHVISGHHRITAAPVMNIASLPARIIDAPDDLSYMMAAIRTNARHGKNFTEDDRKDLAVKLKALGQSTSDIAKLFGVHRVTAHNWLTSRDSNASKKNNVAREQAQNVLAGLGIQDLSDEWQHVPTVTADTKRLAKIGTTINDFLAETPVSEDKAYIVAWARSLEKVKRQSFAQDMLETIQWLTNVVTILKSEV
jgi:ParB-like chromosome segregation protein Spo0J